MNSRLNLKARVACKTCSGWLAIGFTTTPGRMVGSSAIIGVDGTVRAYRLRGKAVSMVEALPEPEQTLRDTKLELSPAGVVFTFTATLGEAGLPADLHERAADVIYAAGPAAYLSYHGGMRGGTSIQLRVRDSATPTNVPLGGGDDALSGVGVGEGQGTSTAVFVILACFLGVVVGAAVAIAAVRYRPKLGGYSETARGEAGVNASETLGYKKKPAPKVALRKVKTSTSRACNSDTVIAKSPTFQIRVHEDSL